MKKYLLFLSFLSLSFLASSQSATWSDNIACIMYTNCTKCHNPNGVGPFSLLTYSDAIFQSGAIKSATQSKHMPPWPADKNYRSFAHERLLSQEEIDLIANWVDNGAPEGVASHAPTIPVYNTSEEITSPDIKVQIPNYTVAGVGDIYRCFVLNPGLSVDQFITALEMVPGNRSIVHHVLLYADTSNVPLALDSADSSPGYLSFGGTGSSSSTLISGWVPGSGAYFYPSGMGTFLPANVKLIAQIHYPQGSAGQIDSTHINLKLTTSPFIRNVVMGAALNHSFPSILDGPLAIPPNQIKTFHFIYNSPVVDVTVLSVAPHMHLVGVSVKAYAVTPIGDTIPLIDIPKWDFHWQGAYLFRKPLRLPANSTVYGTATYDNTTANPNNPNSPPQWVTAGEATTDEMMLIYFGALAYFPGDDNIIIDTTTVKATYNDCEYSTAVKGFINSEVISIYPNPVNNMLFVEYDGLLFDAKLYNSNGEMVWAKNHTLSFSNFSIPTTDINSGQYILVLTDGAQSISKKVVIFH